MTLEEFQRRAIGVPFLEHGRDYDGWDCWGLVVCAFRDVLGVEVPDYVVDHTRYNKSGYRQITQCFEDRNGGFWQQTDCQPMRVACIFRRGLLIHAGLCVDKRRILHVERGIETCLERITRFNVEGFYGINHRATSLQN